MTTAERIAAALERAAASNERLANALERIATALEAPTTLGCPPNTIPHFRGIDADTGQDIMILVPQFPAGAYRVDFLLATSNLTRKVVVECDGHEWHHATKEQVDRDNTRRNWLQSQGYTVLNFSGRTLTADPAKCAKQAIDLCLGR